MSEMVERVARAICWSDIADEQAATNYVTGEMKKMRDIISQESCFVDQKYERMARAAIAAMREPTEEMMRVGMARLSETDFDNLDRWKEQLAFSYDRMVRCAIEDERFALSAA
jgi:hypothetical protein